MNKVYIVQECERYDYGAFISGAFREEANAHAFAKEREEEERLRNYMQWKTWQLETAFGYLKGKVKYEYEGKSIPYFENDLEYILCNRLDEFDEEYSGMYTVVKELELR